MEADILKLTEFERKLILELFQKYVLHEYYRDEAGKMRKRLMRQRIIWIQDKNFLEKNKKSRSVLNLLDKKVINKHLVGYKFTIKKDFFQQIYNLADNGDWELVGQMSAVWLEVDSL